MSQLVLYLLMQAVGTLGFAYSMGSQAVRRRTLGNVLAATGMYMIMGAALIEVAADRLGWRPSWLAADLALVTAGVGMLGASVLTRVTLEGRAAQVVRLLLWAMPIVSVGCAVALVALSGADGAVVDLDGLRAETFEEGRAHLTATGWALGAPLAMGVAALILVGSHDVLTRRKPRAVWLWASGVLLLLWPFDLHTGDVTLMPVLLLFGMAGAYFGMVPDGKEKGPIDGGDEEGPHISDAGPGGPQGRADLLPLASPSFKNH